MVVVNRLRGRGMGNVELQHPWSRTMIYPPNRARVATARQAAGGWTQVTRLNGLGQMAIPVLPTWAWIAGGLAAGGVATFAFLKMRKRR
jgi:hypothetical protein